MDNKPIINHLYEIILEANLQRPDEEILSKLQSKPDSDVDKYLGKIRFYRTKTNSQINKSRFSKAKNEIEEMISSYGNQLKELFSGEDYELLLRFHRNFEKTTEKDGQSMLKDKKLLELLKKIKNELNDRKKG